jgi:RNA polymerase sigma-70 factor (family 1)
LNSSADIRELQREVALYENMGAYRALYDLLYDSLFRFSLAFVKSNEAAEEIVSDVFVKLWQIRNRLIDIENLKEYLYIITKNFSLNYIAKNYKYPVIRLEEIDIEPVFDFGNPEDLCISADLVNKLRETIQTLPPKCRIVFQLVKEENLRYKEVAAILNISVFTVRNQVAIATRKLAETLPAYLRPVAINS